MAAAGGARPILVTSIRVRPRLDAHRARAEPSSRSTNRSARSHLRGRPGRGQRGLGLRRDRDARAGDRAPLDVVLPPGRYSFECEAFSGVDRLLSRVGTRRRAPVSGAHPYMPVTSGQIQLATLAYRASLISTYMQRLATDTDSADGCRRGRPARDGRPPLAAGPPRLRAPRRRLRHLRHFNDEINGRPLGLVGGVDSPDFQGFLRLEYGLWHGQTAERARAGRPPRSTPPCTALVHAASRRC